MGQKQQPSTTTVEPPKYLQPYLKDIASEAQNLYQPGLTGAEQGAIDTAQGYAPMIGQGLDTMGATARGDFLFGGQGFNEALDAASRRIQPQVQSMFGRSGRSGSGLAQTAMTQALSDSFASQYGQERGRQQQAAMGMPGMVSQATQQQMGLAQMPEDVLFGNLGRYANILNPQAGMGSSSTSPMYKNTAGGALLGAGLGSIYGAPLGTMAAGASGLSALGALGGPLGMIGGGILGSLL